MAEILSSWFPVDDGMNSLSRANAVRRTSPRLVSQNLDAPSVTPLRHSHSFCAPMRRTASKYASATFPYSPLIAPGTLDKALETENTVECSKFISLPSLNPPCRSKDSPFAISPSWFPKFQSAETEYSGTDDFWLPLTISEPAFQPLDMDSCYDYDHMDYSDSDAEPSDWMKHRFAAGQQYCDCKGDLWDKATEILECYYLHPADLSESEFISLVCIADDKRTAWLEENLNGVKLQVIQKYMTSYRLLIDAGINPSWISIEMFEFMTNEEQALFVDQCKSVVNRMEARGFRVPRLYHDQKPGYPSKKSPVLDQESGDEGFPLWKAALTKNEFEKFSHLSLVEKNEFIREHKRAEENHFRQHQEFLIAEGLSEDSYDHFVHLSPVGRQFIIENCQEAIAASDTEESEQWDKLIKAIGCHLFELGLKTSTSVRAFTPSCSEDSRGERNSKLDFLEAHKIVQIAARITNLPLVSSVALHLEHDDPQSRWSSDSEFEAQSSVSGSSSLKGIFSRSRSGSLVDSLVSLPKWLYSPLDPLNHAMQSSSFPIISPTPTSKESTEAHDDTRTATPDSTMPNISRFKVKTPMNSTRSVKSISSVIGEKGLVVVDGLGSLTEEVKKFMAPPYTYSPTCSKSPRISLVVDSPRTIKSKSSRLSFSSVLGPDGVERWGTVKKTLGRVFDTLGKRSGGKGSRNKVSLSKILRGGDSTSKAQKRGSLKGLF